MIERVGPRIAIVTGAARMGRAIAQVLVDRRMDAVFSYAKSKEDAEAAAGIVRAAGQRALAVHADVTDERSCDSLIRAVDTEFGRLDALICLASVYVAVPFDQLTVEQWDQHLAVDLRGTFLCARAAVPLMKRSGGGRIITVSDWLPASGRPRYKDYLTYYVAKAGVKALTEALALELAGDRILVNAIAPGPILPPPGTSDEEFAAVVRATPLGRWGGPEAIAQAVGTLIDTEFITGETIRVDGGRHLA